MPEQPTIEKPSIVIGVGTMGSEIATRLYQRSRQMATRSIRPIHENLVQFLLIDGDRSPSGAEDLCRKGNCLKISVADPAELLGNLREKNPFFKNWWYPGFRRVGGFFPGMGTVPIKGRLGFWHNLADPANPSSLHKAFDTLRNNAQHVGSIGSQQQLQLDVFIVGSLSGGSGSGMALDIAFLIRQLAPKRTKIKGMFLLPSVVGMRAAAAANQQIRANGYAALTAVNFWQSGGKKPKELDVFMDFPGCRKIEPTGGEFDVEPFDVVYLIGQQNEDDKRMSAFGDYTGLVVDALTSEVLAIGSRAIDFEQRMIAGAVKTHQSLRWASIGVAGLAFDTEKTLGYLNLRYTELEISAFLQSADAARDLDKYALKQAEEFMETWHIRELSPDPQTAMDEVIYRLQDNETGRQVYADVQWELALKKTKKDEEAINQAENLWKEQKRNQTDQIEHKEGIPFVTLLRDNSTALLHSVVEQEEVIRQSSTSKESSRYPGLDEWLSKIVREKGWVGANACLLQLKSNLEAHKKSIVIELEGIGESRGEEEMLDNLEKDRKNFFKQLKSGGGKADQVRTKWWDKWLKAYRQVLVKREVVKFYDALQAVVDQRLLVLAEIRAQYVELQGELSSGAQSLVGNRVSGDTREGFYVLDERILGSGAQLNEVFLYPALALEDGVGVPNAPRTRLLPDTTAQYLLDILTIGFGEVVGAERLKRLEYLLKGAYPSEAKEDKKIRERMEKLNKAVEAEKERRGWLQRLMTQVQTELSKESSALFQERVNSFDVWTAMAEEARLEGKKDNKKIVDHVMNRIQTTVNRCLPFWPINLSRAQVEQITVQPWAVFDYSETAYVRFCRQYNDSQKLPLDNVFLNKLGQPLEKGQEAISEGRRVDVETDPLGSVFRISFFHGGIPLDCLTEYEDLRYDFEQFRENFGDAAPVFSDYRYEKIISGPPGEDDRYTFLVAEALGTLGEEVIDFPSPLADGSTVGSVRFDVTPLGQSREEAFELIKEGGNRHDLMEKIKSQVDGYMDSLSPEDRAKILGRSYVMLRNVAKKPQRAEVRERLEHDLQIIARHFDKDYDIKEATILRRCKEWGIEVELGRRQSAAQPIEKLVPQPSVPAAPAKTTANVPPKAKPKARRK